MKKNSDGSTTAKVQLNGELIEIVNCINRMEELIHKVDPNVEKYIYPDVLEADVDKNKGKTSPKEKTEYLHLRAKLYGLLSRNDFNTALESSGLHTSGYKGVIDIVDHGPSWISVKINKISKCKFIGIGQGGSNIAQHLANHISPNPKEDLVQILTTTRDAEGLINSTLIGSIGSLGGRSFQGGREIAYKYKDSISMTLDNINNTTVFLCYTLGGGSGSGCADIIAQILLANKNIVFGIAVTPLSETEDLNYYTNATNSINSIVHLVEGTSRDQIGEYGLFVVKNDTLKRLAGYEIDSPVQRYDSLNDQLLNLFNHIFRFDDYHLNRTIDTRTTIDYEEYASVVWGRMIELGENEKGEKITRLVSGRGILDHYLTNIDIKSKEVPDITLDLAGKIGLDHATDVLLAICIPESATPEDILLAEKFLEKAEYKMVTKSNTKTSKDGKVKEIKRRFKFVRGIVNSDDDNYKMLIIASHRNPTYTIEQIKKEANHAVNELNKNKRPITNGSILNRKEVEKFKYV